MAPNISKEKNYAPSNNKYSAVSPLECYSSSKGTKAVAAEARFPSIVAKQVCTSESLSSSSTGASLGIATDSSKEVATLPEPIQHRTIEKRDTDFLAATGGKNECQHPGNEAVKLLARVLIHEGIYSKRYNSDKCDEVVDEVLEYLNSFDIPVRFLVKLDNGGWALWDKPRTRKRIKKELELAWKEKALDENVAVAMRAKWNQWMDTKSNHVHHQKSVIYSDSHNAVEEVRPFQFSDVRKDDFVAGDLKHPGTQRVHAFIRAVAKDGNGCKSFGIMPKVQKKKVVSLLRQFLDSLDPPVRFVRFGKEKDAQGQKIPQFFEGHEIDQMVFTLLTTQFHRMKKYDDGRFKMEQIKKNWYAWKNESSINPSRSPACRSPITSESQVDSSGSSSSIYDIKRDTQEISESQNPTNDPSVPIMDPKMIDLQSIQREMDLKFQSLKARMEAKVEAQTREIQDQKTEIDQLKKLVHSIQQSSFSQFTGSSRVREDDRKTIIERPPRKKRVVSNSMVEEIDNTTTAFPNCIMEEPSIPQAYPQSNILLKEEEQGANHARDEHNLVGKNNFPKPVRIKQEQS